MLPQHVLYVVLSTLTFFIKIKQGMTVTGSSMLTLMEYE
jgi:hypothetical protein